MTDIKLTVHFTLADGTQQVINMSKEAFDDMRPNIEGNLRKIAHDLHAVSLDYYIAGN